MNALHRLDLNLLLALDAMLDERSVTRAARRLGLTQSAMSHSLRRARDHLGDPLLVRRGDSMVPTPRAEALRGPLRDALEALARALDAPRFEPATSTRRFRIAAPDLFSLLVLPALAATVAAAAPGVDLVVVSGRSDDVDLFVAPLGWAEGPVRPSELRQRVLFQDAYACFARGEPLDLDAYAARPHVVVSPTGEGPSPIDDALAREGRRRRIALRVAGFAEAVAVVAATDLVLSAPSSLQRLLAVPARPLPVALPPQSIALRWHARLDADPGHRWLRELVREAAAAR